VYAEPASEVHHGTAACKVFEFFISAGTESFFGFCFPVDPGFFCAFFFKDGDQVSGFGFCYADDGAVQVGRKFGNAFQGTGVGFFGEVNDIDFFALLFELGKLYG